MTAITTKIELLNALKDSNECVTKWFTEIPAEDFFARHGEVWSASDNVDHLIKSHKPIAKALRLPKFTLQAMFGKPEKTSMTYEELCEIYRDAIAKGGQAFWALSPRTAEPRRPGKSEFRLVESIFKSQRGACLGC